MKFLDASHRNRKWRLRHPRKYAKKRAPGTSNALPTHSKRNPTPLEILKALARKAVRLAGGPKKVLVLTSAAPDAKEGQFDAINERMADWPRSQVQRMTEAARAAGDGSRALRND